MSDVISQYTRRVLSRNNADVEDLLTRATQEDERGHAGAAAHLRELAATRKANADRLAAATFPAQPAA